LAQANRTLATNLALLALVGVVGVFGAWLSSGPLVVRPVRALIKATRRLAVGDLTARVEGAPGISELNQLALAFDQMAETLEKHSGQLAESEARFRTLVEQTPAITYVATLDDLSSTLYISPRIQDLLGYSPAEWQAAPELWSRQIHPDDYERVLAELNRSRASGEPFRCEYRMFARDGHLLWLEDTADIVRDESGQSLFLQGLMLDITARKRADEALRAYALQLERSNRELQDFAYVASHDLQEPLRKVQAFGERLVTKYRDALGAEGRDYLDRMHSAAGRMQTMINDLLAYSRVATKAHPSVKVSLTQVARGVLSDLETRIAESHGTVELGDLPTLEADPSQMRQLLQNLIANALKFRRPDVPSLVRVYGQPLAGAPGGEFVQIMVEDNGIGFDTKYLDRIFQPFQRLHGREEYEGTGIGLAICRKIAERHGGHITATSAPGQGATFIVTLPAKQPQGGNPE
jgi:PAS domain S-box-containing protein